MISKIPAWMKVLLAACFGLVIALAVSRPENATNLLPHANGLATISNQQLQAAYAKLPLSFEANLGQTDDSVKFFSRGSGYSCEQAGGNRLRSCLLYLPRGRLVNQVLSKGKHVKMEKVSLIVPGQTEANGYTEARERSRSDNSVEPPAFMSGE